MKKLLLLLPIVIILILLSAAVVFAEGSSARISVSCTVPLIPGMNSPALIEEESTEVNRTAMLQEENKLQEETLFTAMLIEEEADLEESSTPEEEPLLVLTKTVYSR
ncbi:MAG: hypothetical protein ABIC18_04745 [Candidatus Omnitrophota bacterium]